MGIEKFKVVCIGIICVKLKLFDNVEKRLSVGERNDIIRLGLCKGNGSFEFSV